MTTKLKQYLKAIIFLFGISLSLWHCEPEQEIITQNIEQTTLDKDVLHIKENLTVQYGNNPFPIYHDINSFSSYRHKTADESVTLELEIQWYEHSKHLDQEFEVFEFPATEKFLDIDSEYIHTFTYSLLSLKKDETLTHYLVKLLHEHSSNINATFNNLDGFSGTAQVYDILGELKVALYFNQGELISRISKDYIDIDTGTKQRGDCNSQKRAETVSDFGIYDFESPHCNSGGGGKYVRVRTDHYTDWYKHLGNNEWEYTSTSYEGSTHEYVWMASQGHNPNTIKRYLPKNYLGSTGNQVNFADFYQWYQDNKEKELNNDCPEGYIKNIDGRCLAEVNEDEIINELTGKADCVYKKMVNNKNNINWILENFKDGNKPSQFNLRFEMSTSLPNKTNASTGKNGNTFTIKINANTLSNRTSLGLARTIIHEGIHARLREFLHRKGGTLSKEDFPGVYEYYRTYGKNWDHQQMADYYRSTIAKGLKQYDNGQHSNQFYNDMAWEGLANIKDANGVQDEIYTEAWKKLTTTEKNRIKNTITTEKDNGNKACQ